MQLAKAALVDGRAPTRARWPRRCATGWSATRASPRWRSPAPGSSTSPSPPTPRAGSRPTSWPRARRTARNDILAGERINVEFISANPTGPLHLGHTRWAVVGDALGTGAEAAGAEVAREFYINDRGNQMNLFGASIEAAALGEPIPEDGYPGATSPTWPRRWSRTHPGILDLARGRAADRVPRGRLRLQLKEQQDQLDGFNTHFDVWFSERSLHDAGKVAAQLEKLREPGPPVRRRRRAVDAHHRLRRRQGPGADPVQRRARPTSPPTRRTTSTSASAASTSASTCSVPTTTATSAGSRDGGLRGRRPEPNIEMLIGQLVKIMKGGEEVRLSSGRATSSRSASWWS